MAISYVGGISGGGTGSSYTVSLDGTLTGGSSSSPSAGDVVVVWASHGSTSSSAPTVTGNNFGAYTGAGNAGYGNDNWDTNARMFYAGMGASVDTQLTIARQNNTTYGGTTLVMVFRGVDSATPLDATGTTAVGTNTARFNPPSVTPTTSGAIVIYGGSGCTAAAINETPTDANSSTKWIGLKYDGSTSDMSSGLGYKGWTSGALDPVVNSNLTVNSASSWAAQTIALRPASPDVTVSVAIQSAVYSQLTSAVTVTVMPIVTTNAQYKNDMTTLIATGGSAIVTTETPAYLQSDVSTVDYTNLVSFKTEIETTATAFNDSATTTQYDEDFKEDNVPENRRGAGIVYDSMNKRYIAFGGYNGTTRYNDTYELKADKPTTRWNKLAPTGTAPTARNQFAHTVVTGKNGSNVDKIYMVVWGGTTGSDSNTMHLLDLTTPGSEVWSTITQTSAPTARSYCSDHMVAKNGISTTTSYIYLYGGWASTRENALFRCTLDFTAATAVTWTTLKANGTAGNPTNTSGVVTAYDSVRDRILIFSGYIASQSNVLYAYDIAGGSFSQLSYTGDTPAVREIGDGGFDAVNNRFWFTGGWESGTAASGLNDVGYIDFSADATGVCTIVRADSTDQDYFGHSSATSCVDTDRKCLIVWSGNPEDDIGSSWAYVIDFNEGVTSNYPVYGLNIQDHFRPRDATGFVVDEDRNELIIVGGFGRMPDDATIASGAHMGEVWSYKPSTNRWRYANKGYKTITPREGAVGVYDTTRDRIIVFGGLRGINCLSNSVWALTADASGNYLATKLNPTGTPPANQWLGAGCFDSGNNRAIFTCGRVSASLINTTFSLSFSGGADGAWTTLSPSGTPPTAVSQPGYANDTANTRLWLYGGATNTGGTSVSSQLLHFNYSTTSGVWTTPSSSGGTARRGGVMGYDASNARLIYWGGHNGTTEIQALEYFNTGGTTWAAASPASSPTARRSLGGGFLSSKLYITSGRPASSTWFGDTYELTPDYGTPNNSVWVNESPKIYQQQYVLSTPNTAGSYHWQTWATQNSIDSVKSSYGGNSESAADYIISSGATDVTTSVAIQSTAFAQLTPTTTTTRNVTINCTQTANLDRSQTQYVAGVFINSTQSVSQTIQPTVSTRTLCSFSALLAFFGASNPASDYTITAKLYTTSGGLPNALVATCPYTKAVDELPLNSSGFEWINFSFYYGLTATNTYALVLETDQPVGADGPIWAIVYNGSGNFYSEGDAFYKTGGDWTSLSTEYGYPLDFAFKQYYYSGQVQRSLSTLLVPTVTTTSSVNTSATSQDATFAILAPTVTTPTNRYWVGGTGDWSDTDHWSTTSGGSGGADAPTELDDVFINSSSGFGSGGTIAIGYGTIANNFTSNTGHTYSITDEGLGCWLSFWGSATLESGLTITLDGSLAMTESDVTKTLTVNNATLNCGFGLFAGDCTLQDDLVYTGPFYQENGTFDANDHNVTATSFSFYADTGYTPTVYMGSGTWEATGEQAAFEVEELGETVTIIPETSTIKLNNTVSEDYDVLFRGFGKTYNNLWLSGTNTQNRIIYNSNTFNDLKIDAGLNVLFEGGTTQTVTTFTAVGSIGSFITLDSNDGITQFTLSKSSGTVSCDYLDISNSNATGGATWYAGSHSVDTTNNNGWLFSDPPQPASLTLTTLTPTVSVTRDVSNFTAVRSATFETSAVIVTTTRNPSVSATIQSASFSLIQPSITNNDNETIAFALQSASFATLAPTVSGRRNVSTSVATQSAVLGQLTPSVSAKRNVSTSTVIQSATFAQLASTVSARRNVLISAAIQSAAFSQLSSTVSARRNTTTSIALQSATFSQFDSTISARRNVSIAVALSTATFTQLTPDVTAEIGSIDITVYPDVNSGVFETLELTVQTEQKNRYWVGGSGDWSDATNHWALTSGGEPNAVNKPTSTEDVFFDSNSGLGNSQVVPDEDSACHNITCTVGDTFSLTCNSYNLSIYGSAVLESGATLSGWFYFENTEDVTITNNGARLSSIYLYFEGSGKVTLLDDFESLDYGSRYLNFINGTFDANNFDVFACDVYVGVNSTINFGDGVWETVGQFAVIDGSSTAFGNSTIRMSSSYLIYSLPDNQTLSPNTLTVNNIDIINDGSVYITGNFNINTFTNDSTFARGIYFNAGCTYTFTNFLATGISDQTLSILSADTGQVNTFIIKDKGTDYVKDDIVNTDAYCYFTVTSVDEVGGITELEIFDSGNSHSLVDYLLYNGTGSGASITVLSTIDQHTLSQTSGVIDCDHLDLINSNATGGATWNAGDHSVNSGNNTGWIFNATSPVNDIEIVTVEIIDPAIELSLGTTNHVDIQIIATSTVQPSITNNDNETIAFALQTIQTEVTSPTIQATRNITASVATQSATFETLSPGVSTTTSIIISTDIQSASFGFIAPIISVTKNISTTVGSTSAVFAQPDSTVSITKSISTAASLTSATFEIPTPTLTITRNSSITPAILPIASGQTQTVISTIDSETITLVQQSASFEIIAPIVNVTSNTTISCSLLSAGFSQLDSTIETATNISTDVDIQSANFATLDISIEAVQNTTQSPALLAVATNTIQPGVSTIDSETLSPAILSGGLSTLTPTVSGQRNVTTPVSLNSYIASQPSATVSASPGWWLADNFTTQVGTIHSGTYRDTWHQDNTYFVLDEASGIPGFTYDFIFNNVEAEEVGETKQVHIRGYYNGDSAHNVKWQQYNYTTAQWTNLTTNTKDMPKRSTPTDYEFPIFTTTDYINTTIGQIQLRVTHTQEGNVADHLYIDYLYITELYEGETNVYIYPEPPQGAIFETLVPVTTGTKDVSNPIAIISAIFSTLVPTVNTTRNISITPSLENATFGLIQPSITNNDDETLSFAPQEANFVVVDSVVSVTRNITQDSFLQDGTFVVLDPTIATTTVININIFPTVQNELVATIPTPNISAIINISTPVAVNEASFSQLDSSVEVTTVADIDVELQPVIVNVLDVVVSATRNVGVTPDAEIVSVSQTQTVISTIDSETIALVQQAASLEILNPEINTSSNIEIASDLLSAVFEQSVVSIETAINILTDVDIQESYFTTLDITVQTVRNTTQSPTLAESATFSDIQPSTSTNTTETIAFDLQTIVIEALDVVVTTVRNVSSDTEPQSATFDTLDAAIEVDISVTTTPDILSVSVYQLDSVVNATRNTEVVPDSESASFSQTQTSITTVDSETLALVQQSAAFDTIDPVISVTRNVAASSTLKEATFGTIDPTVLVFTNITAIADIQSTSFSIPQPTTSSIDNEIVSATTQGATFDTLAPVIYLTDAEIVSAALQSISLETIDPTINVVRQVTITPTIENIVSESIQPSLTTNDDETVAAGGDSTTFDTPQPTVTTTRATIAETELQAASFDTPQPTITSGEGISIEIDILLAALDIIQPTTQQVDSESVNAYVNEASFGFLTPTINTTRSTTVEVDPLNAVFGVMGASVSGDVNEAAITPEILEAVFTVPIPAITVTDNESASVIINNATFEVLNPVITASINTEVQAGIQTLAIEIVQPSLSFNDNEQLAPDALSATFSTLQPVIIVVCDASVPADQQSATFNALSPSVATTIDTVLPVAIQALDLVIISPIIFTSDDELNVVATETITILVIDPTVLTTRNVSVGLSPQNIVISQAVSTVVVAIRTCNVKRWNGTSWELHHVRLWTGSVWVTKPLMYWDGNNWTQTPH
jgi:hypothetical protein